MTTAGFDSFFLLAQSTAPTTAQPVAPAGLPGGTATSAPLQPQTAQALPGTQQQGATPAPAGSPPMSGFMFITFGLLALMVGMTVWTSRKEKKKREAMLSAVTKGAKVVTNGGIMGTVTELGDDYVILRLEEGRIRLTRSAIAGVMGESKSAIVAEPKNSAVTTNA